MERDEIIQHVENIFSNFIIEEVYDDEEEEDPTLIQFNIWNEDETCKYIYFGIMLFDDNLITIDYVENCGQIGIGTIMMGLIEQLANTIGSKAIELIEHSQIIMKTKKMSMSISLSLLNTLKSGQSWYNSKGYICKNLSQIQHFERIAQNTSFIQLTHMNEIGVDPNLLSKIHKKNPLLDPTTNIQTYFTIVSEILKNWKDCKYLKSLVDLINMIAELKVVVIDCKNDAMIKQLIVGAIVNKKYRKHKTNKKPVKKRTKTKKHR